MSNFGVAPEITAQYLESFGVKQKVNRGIKYAKQLKIASVPMIVVDGNADAAGDEVNADTIAAADATR